MQFITIQDAVTRCNDPAELRALKDGFIIAFQAITDNQQKFIVAGDFLSLAEACTERVDKIIEDMMHEWDR
jgi:hypothetical protein